MFQMYENAENSTYSFEFKLDLTLLNVLRSFTHNNHEFTEGINMYEIRLFGEHLRTALLLLG